MKNARHERRGIVAVLGDAVARGDIAATGGANAWDGWDDVPTIAVDKAFALLDDMDLDATSIKVLILSALGVGAENIGEVLASGRI